LSEVSAASTTTAVARPRPISTFCSFERIIVGRLLRREVAIEAEMLRVAGRWAAPIAR
jgi:hypothetical protein